MPWKEYAVKGISRTFGPLQVMPSEGALLLHEPGNRFVEKALAPSAWKEDDRPAELHPEPCKWLFQDDDCVLGGMLAVQLEVIS